MKLTSTEVSTLLQALPDWRHETGRGGLIAREFKFHDFAQAFGFMALLGLLSLTGMLIKNAVVLVDEIDRQIAAEVPRLTAIIEASASRLRPVTMAAGTTVLGMVPLLFDPFFANMAVTIMGGLGFATLLTLLAVPCLYLLLMKVRPEETA